MSVDLALGRTSRDWSCGMLSLETRRVYDELRDAESTQALGTEVAAEVRATFDLVASLTSRGQLPADVRRSYRPFLQSWQKWSAPRAGKYGVDDYVALLNFRARNKQYLDRLASLEARPAAPTAPTSPDAKSTPSPGRVVRNFAILAAGLVVGAKLVDSNLKNRRSP